VETAHRRPEIDEAALAVLDVIPTPVSIFDPATLHFLAVNAATAQELARGIDELLQMSIAELRPPEDVEALHDAVAAITAPVTDAGHWRMRKGDGGWIEVGTRWRRVTFRGRDAVLATWYDLHHLQTPLDDGATVSQEREIAPQRAEATARLYRAIFEAAPSKLLVMTPGSYEIVAASNSFLAATNCRMDEIRGRSLFEVFPDDPSEPEADGLRNLRASLRRVEQSRSPDIMAVQRHPIRCRDDEGGGFEERFWSQVNAPVLDPEGQLVYIIHRVEDVTELARMGEDALIDPLEKTHRELARDIVLRSQELGRVNTVLQEQAARIRTAERLLDLGMWTYDLQSKALTWSDRVRELYAVPRDRDAPDFDGYVALVHPDDRAAMVAGFHDFLTSSLPHWSFKHRILRSDGVVVHIKGVGERILIDGREQIVGLVQDVTPYVMAEQRLSQVTGLMKMAGDRARLGGWRVDLAARMVNWSDETAAIHEEPPGTQPTVDQALDYYLPEGRPAIQARFTACAQHGTDFDEVIQIRTAKGNRIWVRAMGEAVRDAQGSIVAIQGAIQDISELVSARDQTEGLARRLRDTLNSINDMFMLLDDDWRYLFINARAEAIIGRHRAELIGKVIWEEYPDSVGNTFYRQYHRARTEGRAVRFRDYSPTFGLWLEVDAHPTPEGLAVYVRDVTEQHAREEQLRLLEAAVSHLNDVVLITETAPIDAPDGPRVVYVNKAIEGLTGFAQEEILGATPRMFQGPMTDRAELDRIRKALQHEQPVHSEIINYTKTGRPYWLDMDIVPLANADGVLTHFVSIQRDMTERKQAEKAIRLRDERFALLSRATNDVIWDWDLETDAIWWNEALTTLFGYDPDATEMASTSWTNRIHPDDRERIVDSIHAAIDGTGTNWAGRYRFMHADGRPRQVVDRGLLLRDGGGKAVRMIGSIIDVTEQQDLEERYRQAQKLEAVGQLTGGVAHDFNNLLTIIMGNAELMQDSLEDGHPSRVFADMTARAADRAAELTNRLLAFSRKQALQPRVTDVNAVISGFEGMLRRTLGEDIDIEIVRAGGLWRTEVDVGQLEAAILNLANNSRDAMPGGGSLTIETANASLDDTYASSEPELLSGQYVVVVLSDTGSGIPKEQIDRVFEPFFTTKDVGKGTGLGLSMVYGFVKQSGGHIRVYSEANEGTTVKMYFPRHFDPPLAPSLGPKTGVLIRGQETILVVEDDEMILRQLSAQLSDLGYTVISASAGAAALLTLGDRPDIDLLFTDVVLPGGMSGRQLADAARESRPDLKVLYTSGYSQNAIVHHGRLDPGVELLSKPYRRAELAAKIRKVLDA